MDRSWEIDIDSLVMRPVRAARMLLVGVFPPGTQGTKADGRAVVLDADSDEFVLVPGLPDELWPSRYMSLSDDGSRLVGTSHDWLFVQTLASGEICWLNKGGAGGRVMGSFTPDGSGAATVMLADGEVTHGESLVSIDVFDWATGTSRTVWRSRGYLDTCRLAWSPDSRLLVASYLKPGDVLDTTIVVEVCSGRVVASFVDRCPMVNTHGAWIDANQFVAFPQADRGIVCVVRIDAETGRVDEQLLPGLASSFVGFGAGRYVRRPRSTRQGGVAALYTTTLDGRDTQRLLTISPPTDIHVVDIPRRPSASGDDGEMTGERTPATTVPWLHGHPTRNRGKPLDKPEPADQYYDWTVPRRLLPTIGRFIPAGASQVTGDVGAYGGIESGAATMSAEVIDQLATPTGLTVLDQAGFATAGVAIATLGVVDCLLMIYFHRLEHGAGSVENGVRVTTYGRCSFVLQSVGEFVLTRSEQYGFEVHCRLSRGGPRLPGSTAFHVATEIADFVVEFEGDALFGNGKEWQIPDGQVLYLGPDSYIMRSRGQYLVAWAGADGPLMSWCGDLARVWVPQMSDGDVGGLLGSGVSGEHDNDLHLADGTGLPRDVSSGPSHADFADSWRVTDVESLFTGLTRDGDGPHQVS